MKEEKYKTKKTVRISKHIITRKKIYYSKNIYCYDYKHFVIISTKNKRMKFFVSSKVYKAIEKFLFKWLKKYLKRVIIDNTKK